MGVTPNQMAESLKKALHDHGNIFTEVEIAGPYVNATLAPQYIAHRIQETLHPMTSQKETILVDYFSANIGKPLHIGHLCSPSIGQSLINAHRYLGYTTIGDNHLGDW